MVRPFARRLPPLLLAPLLGLVLGGWLLVAAPARAGAAVDAAAGGALFAQHCSGCHVNGGNIIRRGKTLKLAALQRQGIAGPEAIAAIAAGGLGQMGGYGGVLGEEGAAEVAAYVWSQALAGWPRA